MQKAARQILALIVIAPSFLCADTVVAIWTGPKITIASDSKRMTTRSGNNGGTENVCKLHRAGDWVVATAGLVASEEEDLVAAIENASTTNGEMFDAVRTALYRIMTLRERFSNTHMYDSGRSVSVILAGVVDGKPSLSRIHVLPAPPALQASGSSTDFTTSVVHYPETRDPQGNRPNRAIEIIGIANAISRLKMRSPREWSAGSDVEVATRLISAEASDQSSSPFVGAPISSLVIDRKGVDWIQKGLCEGERPK